MFNISNVLKDLNIDYSSNFDINEAYISKLSNLHDSGNGSIGFIDHKRKDKELLLEKSTTNIIICDESLQSFTKNLIFVSNPKLVFSFIGNHMLKQKEEFTIDSSARIHPEAQIDFPVYIGANTYIGKSKIGRGSYIYSNVSIYDNIFIGENVTINSGTVVGSDGFGYNRNSQGVPIQFPHVGKVVIEEFVEIGANSSIDIGALSNTKIGSFSKLDNLVHIGHNVQIGSCVMIAALSSIAGSCYIGDYTNIWTGCTIADGINIGSSVDVGIGSVVISNIQDNKKCFGNPAKIYSENNKL